MSDSHNTLILGKVDAFEQALASASNEAGERARYQCGRLAQALRFSHAEGIRFAAYTISHILSQPHAPFDATVHTRFAELREALQQAGHHF